MHHTDKYSQHSSIIWPVWLNGWVFIYKLNDCGFESRCSHLNFRFRACFEQGVPWHSGNYRVWIHSETRTWHDKNIQLKFLFLHNSLIFFVIICMFIMRKKIYLRLHSVEQWSQRNVYYPAGICLLKFNKRNTRTRCEICSKLTIETPERRN